MNSVFCLMVKTIELRKWVIILMHRRGGVLKDTQRNTQNFKLNVDLF